MFISSSKRPVLLGMLTMQARSGEAYLGTLYFVKFCYKTSLGNKVYFKKNRSCSSPGIIFSAWRQWNSGGRNEYPCSQKRWSQQSCWAVGPVLQHPRTLGRERMCFCLASDESEEPAINALWRAIFDVLNPTQKPAKPIQQPHATTPHLELYVRYSIPFFIK